MDILIKFILDKLDPGTLVVVGLFLVLLINMINKLMVTIPNKETINKISKQIEDLKNTVDDLQIKVIEIETKNSIQLEETISQVESLLKQISELLLQFENSRNKKK